MSWPRECKRDNGGGGVISKDDGGDFGAKGERIQEA